MSNIVTACAGHHREAHEGLLAITGVAPDRLVFVFRRAGDDEPHLVLTSEPVWFQPLDAEEEQAQSHVGLNPAPVHDSD